MLGGGSQCRDISVELGAEAWSTLGAAEGTAVGNSCSKHINRFSWQELEVLYNHNVANVLTPLLCASNNRLL